MQNTLPVSTRRLLTALQASPDRYVWVKTQLHLLGLLLTQGRADTHLVGCAGTDWRRLRSLAAALRDEARAVGVVEAVVLFERLMAMADVALVA